MQEVQWWIWYLYDDEPVIPVEVSRCAHYVPFASRVASLQYKINSGGN
jgi:hypothetical protein